MTHRMRPLLLCFALVLAASLVAAQPMPGEPPAEGGLTGKVLETVDAGPYTYVQVSDGSRTIWAAGPRSTVAVGDTIVVPPGMAMKNFTSKTLQRTFEEIYFVNSLGKPGAAAAPVAPSAPAPALEAQSAPDLAPLAAHRGNGNRPPAAASGVDLNGILKADGGQTVAELYTGKAELAGQPVVVRGRVIKFTAAVMGKNWIHLQDSSGASGDLTLTTSAVAKVGDLIVVRGNLGVDRDFGAGYRYDIVIEDAAVTVE